MPVKDFSKNVGFVTMEKVLGQGLVPKAMD